MANLVYSGSAYIDTTGVVYTGKCKVAYIFYTPNNTTDSITLYDSASTSANIKIYFQHGTNKDTEAYSLEGKPLVFTNGIYAVISGTPKLTLILTTEGAST